MSYNNSRPRRRRRKYVRPFVAFLAAAIVVTAGFFAFRHFYNDVFYPVKYSEYVEKYAAMHGLDTEFVYAVIHSESGFDPNAVSSADAKGLMQIMDDTFEWLQTKDDTDEVFSADRLFDPEINIKYGTLLLQLNMESYYYKQEVLVAYHQGRRQLQNWLDNPDISADGAKLDHIPSSVTKAYVDNVFKAEQKYKEIINKE